MTNERHILLSFDVEEFDLPLEYGLPISTEDQLGVGHDGLQQITPLLNRDGVRTTLFTTAFFAEHHPAEIRTLAEEHEIASHTYHHSSFEEKDLLSSKEKLASITGKAISGLRMPRMKEVPPKQVLQAGYSYNSSLNPCWVPGRYNNMSKPRKPFIDQGLLNMPLSVTPVMRIPLFWLAFKNLPYAIYRKLVMRTLKKDGHVCLYFHPWEFTDLSSYALPRYIKGGDHKALLEKLNRLVDDLLNEGRFMTMQEFVNISDLGSGR